MSATCDVAGERRTWLFTRTAALRDEAVEIDLELDGLPAAPSRRAAGGGGWAPRATEALKRERHDTDAIPRASQRRGFLPGAHLAIALGMHRTLLLAFLALTGCSSSGSGVCAGTVDTTPDICDTSTAAITCAANYEEEVVAACHGVDSPTINGDYGACGTFLVAHGASLLADWYCFYDAATGTLAGSISCTDTANECGSLCSRHGAVGLCCDKLPTSCPAP